MRGCVGEEWGLASTHLICTDIQHSGAKHFQGGCYLQSYTRTEVLKIWENVVED